MYERIGTCLLGTRRYNF